MQQHIIRGTIAVPTDHRQKQLHRQLVKFADRMQRTKDTGELLKDRRRSVPKEMLPMLF